MSGTEWNGRGKVGRESGSGGGARPQADRGVGRGSERV